MYLDEGFFIKIISFLTLIAYFYTLFISYLKSNKDKMIPIIFIIFSILFGLANIVFSYNKLESFLYLACMCFIIFILWKNAQKIKQSNDKNNEEVINHYIQKYVVTFSLFVFVGLITLTPLTDWISGPNGLYSSSFVFIFIMICFTLYLIYNSIRDFNLFKSQSNVYDPETVNTTDKKYWIPITLSVWVFYNLLVFSGFKYIGSGLGKQALHDIIIAILTFAIMGAILGYFSYTNKNCKTWNKDNLNNDFIEVKSNIISISVTILILIILNKFVPV